MAQPGVGAGPVRLTTLDDGKLVVLRGTVGHTVKDEELGFGAVVCSVGNASRFEIRFGFASDIARVPGVRGEAATRLDDVADQAQGRDAGEGVDEGSGWVGQ